MTISVRRATSAETRDLRHAVLRPGRPIGVLDSPVDEIAVTIAAYDDERVVGCVRIFPDAYHEVSDAWRLGGMAVAPAYQGLGIGRLIEQAAVRDARGLEVPLLWANARTSALGFYEKSGWQVVGDEFIHTGSGLPHYVIVLHLDDPD